MKISVSSTNIPDLLMVSFVLVKLVLFDLEYKSDSFHIMLRARMTATTAAMIKRYSHRHSDSRYSALLRSRTHTMHREMVVTRHNVVDGNASLTP